MDYDRVKRLILAVFAAILFAVVCHIAGRVQGRRIGYEKGLCKGYEQGYNAPHPSDTITTTDTIFIDRPVEVEKWREKLVFLPVRDTQIVRVHDTTYVALIRESKRYSGDDYEAQVSGVEPSLDWIKVVARTEYITSTIPDRRRWTFGVSAGPGVLYDGKGIHGGVGIVAGLQYRF